MRRRGRQEEKRGKPSFFVVEVEERVPAKMIWGVVGSDFFRLAGTRLKYFTLVLRQDTHVIMIYALDQPFTYPWLLGKDSQRPVAD